MSTWWLWGLWMCGWIGGNLINASENNVWRFFIFVATIVAYFLLIFKIGTMITII